MHQSLSMTTIATMNDGNVSGIVDGLTMLGIQFAQTQTQPALGTAPTTVGSAVAAALPLTQHAGPVVAIPHGQPVQRQGAFVVSKPKYHRSTTTHSLRSDSNYFSRKTAHKPVKDTFTRARIRVPKGYKPPRFPSTMARSPAYADVNKWFYGEFSD